MLLDYWKESSRWDDSFEYPQHIYLESDAIWIIEYAHRLFGLFGVLVISAAEIRYQAVYKENRGAMVVAIRILRSPNTAAEAIC